MSQEPEIHAHRASAAVALATGNTAEAIEYSRASVAASRIAGTPSELGLSRLVEARALAASGRRDDAIAVLESAREIGHECGAVSIAERAVAELRSLGVRTDVRSGRGTSGIRSLSNREREIANLAADGLTNQQIANKLYISPRTVETHLTKVFAKLGAESRTDVAVIVQRSRIGSSTEG